MICTPPELAVLTISETASGSAEPEGLILLYQEVFFMLLSKALFSSTRITRGFLFNWKNWRSKNDRQ